MNLGLADALRRRLPPQTSAAEFPAADVIGVTTYGQVDARAPTGLTYFFFAGFFFAAVFLAAGFFAADLVFALVAAFFAMMSSVSGMAMSKQCTCESLVHCCDSYRTT